MITLSSFLFLSRFFSRSPANDKLALLEKIQEGTIEALETIELDGFDADEQKEALEKKIKKGTSSEINCSSESIIRVITGTICLLTIATLAMDCSKSTFMSYRDLRHCRTYSESIDS